MEEVNYNETVVIPFLEKKCKDLLALNLILEAKLLIEQNKVKNYETFTTGESEKSQSLLKQVEMLKQQSVNEIQNLQLRINNLQNEKNNIETERNNLSKELENKQTNFAREVSVKDSILKEYKELKAQFDSLTSEFNALKQSINTKKVKEPKLV